MSAKVPLLDLQAQYRPIRDEILAAIVAVCDSQRFIMGPEIEALESELAVQLGIRHAIAVSSGTDALLLALMALDIGAGRRGRDAGVFLFRDGRRDRARSARGPCSSTSIRRRSISIRPCGRGDEPRTQSHPAGPSVRHERGSGSDSCRSPGAPACR